MTASDLISAALEDLGILDPGMGPSSDDLAVGLRTLNQLLKSTAVMRFGINAPVTESFPLTSGVDFYTIGPGGDFDTVRPHKIITIFARSDDGQDYPLRVLSREDYASVGLKSVQGSFPEACYLETEYPLAKLFLWPVPGSGYTLHIQSQKPFSGVSSASDTINLPDEFDSFLQYRLAAMLAPKYRVAVPPIVVSLALEAEKYLKTLHAQPVPIAQTDPIRKSTDFDIYRGY